MYRVLILVTALLVNAGIHAIKIQIEKPEWPLNYKACVRHKTDREFITVGWYVDTEGQRMRLDSYGIPKENKYTYESGSRRTFEYACEPIGEPLYVYMYHFGIGKQLNLMPSPTPPYKQCIVYNITNSFPPSPLLPHVTFLERTRDNVTVYDHWRSEYFLFTMDYYFHVVNGLPYKMFVNAEVNEFISFEVGDQPDDVFLPPKNVPCYYGTDSDLKGRKNAS